MKAEDLHDKFIRGLTPDQMEEIKSIGLSLGFYSFCSDTDYSQFTGISFWPNGDMCAGYDQDFEDHLDFEEITYEQLLEL